MAATWRLPQPPLTYKASMLQLKTAGTQNSTGHACLVLEAPNSTNATPRQQQEGAPPHTTHVCPVVPEGRVALKDLRPLLLRGGAHQGPRWYEGWQLVGLAARQQLQVVLCPRGRPLVLDPQGINAAVCGPNTPPEVRLLAALLQLNADNTSQSKCVTVVSRPQVHAGAA